MALFFCPNCGGKLSEKAIKCPHCNVMMDSLFPKDSISLDKIEINTQLEHPILGFGIVTKIGDNRMVLRFEDGIERKFITSSAYHIFKNVYVKEPYVEYNSDLKESPAQSVSSSTNYDQDYGDINNEDIDYDYIDDIENDTGPDNDMETYEYYYGDDEIVGRDEWY